MEPQGDLATLLRPFHDRAKLAEDRLAMLETALQSAKQGSKGGVDAGIIDSLLELRAKLETAKAEQIAEKQKAEKQLAASAGEIQKLHYQVLILKRSLEEADKKLEVNLKTSWPGHPIPSEVNEVLSSNFGSGRDETVGMNEAGNLCESMSREELKIWRGTVERLCLS